MTKLMHIDASPRGTRSHSRQAALAFIEAYRQRYPHDEVETLDLWSANLPRFDGRVLEAKYALLSGQALDPAQEAAWQAVVDVFEHFKGADKFLLSVPM